MITLNRKLILMLWFALFFLLLAAGCSLINDGSGPSETSQPAAQSGTILVDVETEPPGQPGSFTVTGVPSGTLSTESSLVVSDLDPGTYSTTQIDPAPDFDVTAVRCDDAGSQSPSSGDPQTRTAVINLEADETVNCVFTNTQRGALVIASETEPEGAAGQFTYTGVPTGTIPSNGTLVAGQLQPGTYTSTQVDPAPQFDLTAVRCDDAGSPTVSAGDPSTRTAVFNLEAGEMVTCTFINTRRGTAVLQAVTEPPGTQAELLYMGVPSGTISADGGTLVTAELPPGTYTATGAQPPPELELTEVSCDDGASGLASGGDPVTRSAIFNIDAGETVTCTFVYEGEAALSGGTAGGSGGSGGSGGNGDSGDPQGRLNPFTDPDEYLQDFPLPDELPPEAGQARVPLSGPWRVSHLAGVLDCGANALDIPSGPPESGTLTVAEDGRQIVGEGLEDAQGEVVKVFADPQINGRYTGSFDGFQQGVPATLDYHWQVVTQEYILGYLTTEFSAQGVACRLYRPFVMEYNG